MTKIHKYHTTAIILAAGCSTRMAADIPKQNMLISGMSMLERCVSVFNSSTDIDSIVLVVRGSDVGALTALATQYSKIASVVSGGNSRAESAAIGFSAIPDETRFVAIHDAARCLVTVEMISAVVCEAYTMGAATAATRVTDTLKLTDEDDVIVKTVPRENMYRAATPQVFSREIYSRALDSAELSQDITDDNMLVERIGVPIRCVDTGGYNLKVTTREDLLLAEFILKKRGEFYE